MSSIRWLPLESNPEVMNEFLKNLGVPTKWGVSDVFSMEEEDLFLIPSPVLAILLLFPIGARANINNAEEVNSGKIYYMKQTIGNACGTVALIHAIANNADTIDLAPNSILFKFINETKNMKPEERGIYLEQNQEICDTHDASAHEGQTEAPSLDEDVSLHFVALVNIDGHLYELDGRKSGPVLHGSTTKETFVKDAFKVCKEFMKNDPENLRFTVLALGARPEQ